MNCAATLDWDEVILWWVLGGVLEKPSAYLFQLEAMCRDKSGGRKLNAFCVCVIHVSCPGLTSSLPCVKFFPVVVWSAACLCYRSPSVLRRTIFSSAIRTLSRILLHLCCWHVGWAFLILWLFLEGFVRRLCVFFFVNLLPFSPVWSQWCVVLSRDCLWCHQ